MLLLNKQSKYEAINNNCAFFQCWGAVTLMLLSKELNESYSVKFYYITTSFMAQTNAMLI